MPADRHADDEPGHDDHAHGGETALGPIDLAAWAAGAVGIVIGLVVAVAFALSTGAIG